MQSDELDETRRWPVDYETLKKGDVITADRLEKLVGLKRDNPRYSLAIMSLKQRIQDDLEDIGSIWTLAIVKNDLRVLTDAEASEYNHRSLLNGMAKMFRSQYRNMAVDVTELTDDQEKDHIRRIEVDGKILQAIRAARKTPKFTDEVRTVPGLPEE